MSEEIYTKLPRPLHLGVIVKLLFVRLIQHQLCKIAMLQLSDGMQGCRYHAGRIGNLAACANGM